MTLTLVLLTEWLCPFWCSSTCGSLFRSRRRRYSRPNWDSRSPCSTCPGRPCTPNSTRNRARLKLYPLKSSSHSPQFKYSFCRRSVRWKPKCIENWIIGKTLTFDLRTSFSIYFILFCHQSQTLFGWNTQILHCVFYLRTGKFCSENSNKTTRTIFPYYEKLWHSFRKSYSLSWFWLRGSCKFAIFNLLHRILLSVGVKKVLFLLRRRAKN